MYNIVSLTKKLQVFVVYNIFCHGESCLPYLLSLIVLKVKCSCFQSSYYASSVQEIYIYEFITNKLHNKIHLSTYARLLQHILIISCSHPQGILTYQGYIWI
jgi:hypothetical protein